MMYCGCCRPMYHYDPTTGGIPPGFPSAINLSVKCVAAAQAQAQAQMKSSEPTSPGGSVMDLSTSSVTSTSPQVWYIFKSFTPTRESPLDKRSHNLILCPDDRKCRMMSLHSGLSLPRRKFWLSFYCRLSMFTYLIMKIKYDLFFQFLLSE